LEGTDGLIIEEEIAVIAKEIMINIGDIPSPIATEIEVAGKMFF